MCICLLLIARTYEHRYKSLPASGVPPVIPMSDPRLPLNCPKCGRPLEWLRVTGEGHRIHIYRCPEHGPFHHSDRKPLTPGEPQ